MNTERSQDWLKEANSDLSFAKVGLQSGFFAHACFISLQAAEKALKAMLFHSGAKLIVTHSLFKLCQTLNINGALEDAAKILDQYYVSARYPDALVEGNPSAWLTEKQAREAVQYAETFVLRANEALK